MKSSWKIPFLNLALGFFNLHFIYTRKKSFCICYNAISRAPKCRQLFMPLIKFIQMIHSFRLWSWTTFINKIIIEMIIFRRIYIQHKNFGNFLQRTFKLLLIKSTTCIGVSGKCFHSFRNKLRVNLLRLQMQNIENTARELQSEPNAMLQLNFKWVQICTAHTHLFFLPLWNWVSGIVPRTHLESKEGALLYLRWPLLVNISSKFKQYLFSIKLAHTHTTANENNIFGASPRSVYH